MARSDETEPMKYGN